MSVVTAVFLAVRVGGGVGISVGLLCQCLRVFYVMKGLYTSPGGDDSNKPSKLAANLMASKRRASVIMVSSKYCILSPLRLFVSFTMFFSPWFCSPFLHSFTLS